MGVKGKIRDELVVLDLGGQYCHLIARRIRQLGVHTRILPSETKAARLKHAKGIILSGGPSSVYDDDSPKIDKAIFRLRMPILGICYGHQLIAHYLGGRVSPGRIKEYGITKLRIHSRKDLFKGLGKTETVWMSHGDTVTELPKGFSILGSTPDCRVAAMGNGTYFGLQFHPEVTHTPKGMKIFENFVKLCKCKRDWRVEKYVKQIIKDVKKKVGNKSVFMLVSGGVDSTVAFALLNKALGTKRVYGLHIDNGLMRKKESSKVKLSLVKLGFTNFHVVDKSEEFLKALRHVYAPETKRRIIGNTFVDVYQKTVRELGLNPSRWMLGQGTIYPDTIETKGTKHADLIKTHHNRVPVIREMIRRGLVVEPLADLYKDEVREVGKELGLPDEMVWRHPFPGPGLGVRCLCSRGTGRVKNKKLVERRIARLCEGLKPVVLPVRSVGVQGDARSYKHPVALIGKTTWDRLESVSTSITNKVREVNRVLWLLNRDDLNQFRLKNAFITKERLDLLREADRIVHSLIGKKLERQIWQFPVVLLPFGRRSKNRTGESIVLRPVLSKEAMTASFARIPKQKLNRMVKELLRLDGIDAIFYDVTHKPPGTIEWE